MKRSFLLKIIVAVVCFALFLWIFQFVSFDFPIALLLGWTGFLSRTLPNISVRWSVVLSVAVYLAIATIAVHFFLTWLHRELRRSAPPPIRWKKRWTVTGMALLFLMFAAGTAAVAISHQSAWLATSPRRLYSSRCPSKLRQIGQGILLYASDHNGQYPPTLAPLIHELDIDVFFCPHSLLQPSPGQTRQEQVANFVPERHCSYVYVGKDLTGDSLAEAILAYDRDGNHGQEGRNFLFNDGGVAWIGAEEAQHILNELAAGHNPPRPRNGPSTRPLPPP